MYLSTVKKIAMRQINRATKNIQNFRVPIAFFQKKQSGSSVQCPSRKFCPSVFLSTYYKRDSPGGQTPKSTFSPCQAGFPDSTDTPKRPSANPTPLEVRLLTSNGANHKFPPLLPNIEVYPPKAESSIENRANFLLTFV